MYLTAACVISTDEGDRLLTAPHNFRAGDDGLSDASDSGRETDDHSENSDNDSEADDDMAEADVDMAKADGDMATVLPISPDHRSPVLRVVRYWTSNDQTDCGLVNVHHEVLDAKGVSFPQHKRDRMFVNCVGTGADNSPQFLAGFCDNAEWLNRDWEGVSLTNPTKAAWKGMPEWDLRVRTVRGTQKARFLKLAFDPPCALIQLEEGKFGK